MTHGTASCQASLYFIPSQSLLMFTKACSFSQRCHPTIRPLLVSSPPTFSLSQHQGLFQWVGSSNQVVRKYWASASVLVLPMNIHGWFPLGLTGLISFLSKGLSRIFSSTTVRKHQFFSAQPSLWSNSHVHIWLLEKTIALTIRAFVGKVMSLLFKRSNKWQNQDQSL